ncbi:MAG TPA: hypothetical protein VHK65_00985 [Candidatus Dormibacteraeota bacterium]|nr:hypothetical protein [Candidatus Dormibacteraeota bacterium]
MWAEVRRLLPGFSGPVLTGVDCDGYPFSIRCIPSLDEEQQVLRVSLPEWSRIAPGPASLLCHGHNQLLWDLRSFMIRGTLEPSGETWLFRPSRFVPGIGIGGLAGMVRFALAKRRAAGRYLDRRGLARPRIDWAQLKAVQARACQPSPAQRQPPG